LTFDAHETVWMNREGKVIAVQTYDGLLRRYEGGGAQGTDYLFSLPIDMVLLKEPSIQAQRYLAKERSK
jgi:hypothetical protein